MAEKRVMLAIMFADISGSTSLFERLGDQKARAATAGCLRDIFTLVRQFKGKVVKTIGDEVMSVFASAEKAADVANLIHEHLGETEYDGVRLSMRIGIHFGPAIIEGKDVFGDAVNLAARMVAQAKANQTITSKSSVDLLPGRLKAKSRYVDTASIKGKKEDVRIYELMWEEEEDVTSMARSVVATVSTPQSGAAVLQLHVKHGDKKLIMDKSHSSLLIGRSKGCDLYVDEQLASRHHVRIELRRDKFFMIDQSTNGTHVRTNGGAEVFLRREEMPLAGDGQISLGRAFDDPPLQLVSFVHGKGS